MTIKRWIPVGIALAAVAMTGPASADDPFPTRPIRIVVNTAPGGLVDFTTRLIAQQMSENLKQQVIVENKAGGDGLIGIRAAKAAPADGYTLLASAGTMTFQPAVKKDPGYDLLRDFVGIGFLARAPFLLVVAPSEPDKSIADLVARAKANPNKLSYASAGVGTGTHFSAAVFLRQADLQLTHVPYKGNGAAMTDVMSGRVNLIFEAYGSGKGYLKSGNLRPLGVTSEARIAALPDLPTIAEQGLPGFSFYTWMGLVAPAGTPPAVVQRLADALRTVKSDKAIRARFLEDGIEAIDMSPQDFTSFMSKELKDAAKLVSDLGIEKQ